MKKLFRNYIWDMPADERKVYLTFDDGPTPKITEWVLAQLEQYKAKATFFCIGTNIHDNPAIFRKLLDCGHSIGNHTFNHVNGWHVENESYLNDVNRCDAQIKNVLPAGTTLFRPPYGKLNRSQSKALLVLGYKIIMWDILSADFDTKISPEKCLQNVLGNINPGTIIIFHDSVKAFGNLETVLPKTLQYLAENGYECAAIAQH